MNEFRCSGYISKAVAPRFNLDEKKVYEFKIGVTDIELPGIAEESCWLVDNPDLFGRIEKYAKPGLKVVAWGKMFRKPFYDKATKVTKPGGTWYRMQGIEFPTVAASGPEDPADAFKRIAHIEEEEKEEVTSEV